MCPRLSVIPKEVGTPYTEWMCPKCGLLRTNRCTHKHGVLIPTEDLKLLREMDGKKKNQLQASLGVNRETY